MFCTGLIAFASKHVSIIDEPMRNSNISGMALFLFTIFVVLRI